MTDEITMPEGLNPKLAALGWLVGRWEGTGHGMTPDGNEFTFEQAVEFGHNGSDYMFYASQTFLLDADGKATEPLDMESGFWRPLPDATLDVVIAHSHGWAEVWTGTIQLQRMDLTTDAVMRTGSASIDYTAGVRVYGAVEGDLMYATDIATATTPLKPYMWARLKRV